MNQRLYQHFGRFIVFSVTVIAPRAGHGVARLPNDKLTRFGMCQPLARQILLGCENVLFDVGAVVDENVGLKLSYRFDELFGFPFVSPLARRYAGMTLFKRRILLHRKVKPQNIDLAIV